MGLKCKSWEEQVRRKGALGNLQLCERRIYRGGCWSFSKLMKGQEEMASDCHWTLGKNSSLKWGQVLEQSAQRGGGVTNPGMVSGDMV